MCLEDNLGRSDVHLAALHDHTNVIVCLMERGMELDMPDKEGKTPAHYAAQHGSLSTLGVLVKNAIDITTGQRSVATLLYTVAIAVYMYKNVLCKTVV